MISTASFAAGAAFTRAAARPKASEGSSSIARRLSAARSVEEIMAVVSHGVRTHLQADGATFVLRRGDRCVYAEEDAVSPLWKGRDFPMAACVSGWCMSRGKTVAIPDVYQDARIPADAYRPTFVRSLAMAPVGRGEAVAALGAYWSEEREPRPDELRELEAIADAAAQAMANLPRGGVEARGGARRRGSGPLQRSRASATRVRTWFSSILVRPGGEQPRTRVFAGYGLAVGCVVLASLIREAVKATGVSGLAVFSTYYPAVLLAMLVGGARAGVLAAALGGLAAYYFFMPPLYRFAPLSASEILNLLLYGGACALIILILERYQRAVRRLAEEDAEHLTLAREQRHRVKNALAVVEAIVHQSLRHDPEQARIIKQRVRAGLADVDLGDAAERGPTDLRALVATELQPYDLTRISLTGNDGLIAADVGRLLALAIHELATNALKHGALTVPQGTIAVDWRLADGQVTLDWIERDGPPVQPPKTRGYGTVMLRRLVEAAGGALTIDFHPAGLKAEIALPARIRR